jgi:hypothetical protein
MIRALLIALTPTGPASVETVYGLEIVIIDGDTIAVGHERIRIENIGRRGCNIGAEGANEPQGITHDRRASALRDRR